MNRRDFLALAGATSATAAWPFATRAQQSSRLPVIGYLNSGNEAAVRASSQFMNYQRGLADAGFVEGRTVALEYRWTDGDNDRPLAFLNELVERRVAVLSLHGILGVDADAGSPFAQALFASGIPAVSGFPRDPASYGYVASLGRPDRNLTGINQQTQELEPKRLNLLRDVVPGARTVGYLARPSSAVTPSLVENAQTAARALGLRLIVLNADTVGEIDAVFAMLRSGPVDTILVGANSFFNNNRAQVTRLVLETRIPAIAEWRSFAQDGALLSYGTNIDATQYQLANQYVAAILKGTKVAELPVAQNQTYEFVINLKTAKALGLTVPPSMLAIATEVIE